MTASFIANLTTVPTLALAAVNQALDPKDAFLALLGNILQIEAVPADSDTGEAAGTPHAERDSESSGEGAAPAPTQQKFRSRKQSAESEMESAPVPVPVWSTTPVDNRPPLSWTLSLQGNTLPPADPAIAPAPRPECPNPVAAPEPEAPLAFAAQIAIDIPATLPAQAERAVSVAAAGPETSPLPGAKIEAAPMPRFVVDTPAQMTTPKPDKAFLSPQYRPVALRACRAEAPEQAISAAPPAVERAPERLPPPEVKQPTSDPVPHAQAVDRKPEQGSTSSKQENSVPEPPPSKSKPHESKPVASAEAAPVSAAPSLSASVQAPAREDTRVTAAPSLRADRADARPVIRTAAPEKPAAAARPAAVRDVAMRVTDDVSKPVEIRFSERGGKVEVAVRTQDPELRASLKGEIGQLVANLEREGFHGKVWTPAEPGVAAQLNEAGSAGNDGASDTPQQRHPQGESGGGRRQHGRDNDSRWLEEFEGSRQNGEKL